jgi:hypothetical protein
MSSLIFCCFLLAGREWGVVGERLHAFNQGFGSGFGSGLDPNSIGPVDPDQDPGGQKWPTKVEKNL